MAGAVVAARDDLLESVPRMARELSTDVREREEMLQAEFEAFLNRLADWAGAGPGYDDDEADAS